MADEEAPTARILWVGADPPHGARAARLELFCEADTAVAAGRAASESLDAVVTDGSDPETVSAVLRAAASNPRCGRRLAASTYVQLPELVRTVEAGLVERVLARPVSAEQLVQVVTGVESRGSLVRPASDDVAASSPADSFEARLRDLVGRLVELPGVVIRPLVATDPVPRLQLVIPTTDTVQALRSELPAMLGPPLKARGAAMDRSYRRHPIRRVLGSLSPQQEVYCQGHDSHAYVAFFPWRDEPKVTVVVGFEPGDSERIADLHDHAVSRAREFPLPTRHHHSPELFYDPDYDWVITKAYVGPDRRRKSTSFVNRYTFRGRRQALMPNELATAGTFVDVAPRWAWITAAVFAVLFLFDTVMTAYYVGGGQVGELNPVMRWALGRSPVLFWTLKSALVVAATFIVMRWHLWTPGRWLFASFIAVYAVLDAYWLLLYFDRTVG
jgi:hypothetical protein